MSVVKEPEFDARLITAIRAALRQARELGYDVERMDITASVVGETCSVHLAPLEAPGYIVAGGDLSLTIDSQSGRILDYQRGQ